ncbi:NADPH-dependent glutamate synthase [Desulfovibrio aminophilus]|uniref:NADPH-dependent glutamate synthase n=1 Tax=Desulfovibrio aminophilus TaxID=81425 RepID=UPI0033973FB1
MNEKTKTPRKPKVPRTPMPEQPPFVRARNFLEVTLGYTAELAALEASRCLQCKTPLCRKGCPVEIDIPGFIARLRAGDRDGAYRVLRQTNSLPAVCGRVCPQEVQCEGSCILGKKGEPVAIGRLERYVADSFAAENGCMQITGETTCALPREIRVACIGSGPSSLTVAGYLSALGVKVTVYEALHELGGVLIYGIPEFRLPKDVVRREVDAMRALDVEFKTNWVGGKTILVRELLDQGFDAVFIGVGAGLPRFMDIHGESLIGVYSANEYLTRVNLGRAYTFPEYDTPVTRGAHVAVFGGGNVAMDAARTALRLGAESVHIVYRRTKGEMPARREELEHALEEGVKLEILANPVRYNGDENRRLVSVTLERQKLGAPDASGRRSPEPTGETFDLPIDTAIIAIGTRPNPILLESTPELKLSKRGYIEVDPETGETSIPGVYAGGDIVTGAATVISAMGAGRRAARSIARKFIGEDAVR